MKSIHLTNLPENMTEIEWADFFIELAEEPPKPTKSAIQRAFWKLNDEYDNKYQIAIAVESVLKSEYRQMVGASSRLLSPKVIELQLLNNFHHKYPWRPYFFMKCCKTGQQQRYMRHWIDVYMDAVETSGQYVARIGNDIYKSWDAVLEVANDRLLHGENILVTKFIEEGGIDYAP